jgi:hypothetical protein
MMKYCYFSYARMTTELLEPYYKGLTLLTSVLKNYTVRRNKPTWNYLFSSKNHLDHAESTAAMNVCSVLQVSIEHGHGPNLLHHLFLYGRALKLLKKQK